MNPPEYTLDDLLRVMQRLRDPVTGCPWDLQQTFASIVPSTLEECYELAQAIEDDDPAHIGEELGDVLFQVVFYAQLGSEQGFFNFASVIHTLVDKLIRRHPHVFAGGEIEGIVDVDRPAVSDVNASWEAIKQAERDARQQSGALDDVPLALPALPRAQKLQKRAAKMNFDWADHAQVLEKLHEEIAELGTALDDGNRDAIDEELGDMLFTCVNLARHLRLDAERSLRRASGKFERRFAQMERLASAAGTSLENLDDEQLDALWNAAKRES
ncbi:MAG: nucleoside triphosphate pyrophosphohydrolase [Gammaproteobacteria bacterium]|nr:nucleoside triphosphate pyrophosphohydrolase [Gammaproteobacteria bacterium]